MTLNDVLSSLRSVTTEWEGFLINPNYIQIGDRQVTWANDTGDYAVPPVTAAKIDELISKAQYSFQINEDQSLLQIHYRWDSKGVLRKAGLTYLARRPLSDTEEVDLIDESELQAAVADPAAAEDDVMDAFESELVTEEVNDSDAMYNDSTSDSNSPDLSASDPLLGVSSDTPVPWIRFDYDLDAKKRGIIHHDAHLHLVAFPSTRIAVSGVPTPRQFVELVASWFYPEIYREQRLDTDNHFSDLGYIQNMNALRYPAFGKVPMNMLAHISIPGVIYNIPPPPVAPKPKKKH